MCDWIVKYNSESKKSLNNFEIVSSDFFKIKNPNDEKINLEKKCVVTIVDSLEHSPLKEMFNVTHLLMEAYAKKINADFIIFPGKGNHENILYRKLDLSQLLSVYTRVLYLDSDILVKKSSPNLFDEVPVNCLGMLDEGDRELSQQDMKNYLIVYEKKLEEFGMPRLSPGVKVISNYYNTGVMIFSKDHSSLFNYKLPCEINEFLGEQCFLNLSIRENSFEMYNISQEFNMMGWNKKHYTCPNVMKNLVEAHFIHLAGGINVNAKINNFRYLMDIIYNFNLPV